MRLPFFGITLPSEMNLSGCCNHILISAISEKVDKVHQLVVAARVVDVHIRRVFDLDFRSVLSAEVHIDILIFSPKRDTLPTLHIQNVDTGSGQGYSLLERVVRSEE